MGFVVWKDSLGKNGILFSNYREIASINAHY